MSQLPVLDTAENAAEARVGRARLGPWTSFLRSLRLFVPVVFFFGVAEGSRGAGLRAPGAGVLSRAGTGTERFIWDMAAESGV